MRFDVFTIFPELISPYLETSILKRAIENDLISVHLHNIRSWAADKHHTTDDTPYGGGGGMVMKPEPVFTAVEEVLGNPPTCPLILLSPQGSHLDYKKVHTLSQQARIGLLCGRYEGVDERIRRHLVSEEISIGDYVLSGGELPVLVLIEAVARLLPGVIGDPDGAADDSFASGLLEYPHYTKPQDYRGWQAPEILLSGNHAAIRSWRREQALLRTLQHRPDLLVKAKLDDVDLEKLLHFSQIYDIQLPQEIINKRGAE